jgi:hypothetical protein
MLRAVIVTHIAETHHTTTEETPKNTKRPTRKHLKELTSQKESGCRKNSLRGTEAMQYDRTETNDLLT